MIINSLKLTIRRLRIQKLNTALHILGLTIGISICLLIGLFLKYEMSYDTNHAAANKIYRINSIWSENGKLDFHYSTPLPLAKTVRAEISGIEKLTLAHPQDQQTIIEVNPEKRFAQEHILIVEPEFLDVFNVELLSGINGHDVLRHPYQAILSKSLAEKIYGKEDPLGKTFLFKNKFNITVGGLMEDLPGNTHLPASMLLSFVPEENYLGTGVDDWTYVSGTSTYIVLPKNADIPGFTSQINTIADKYINPKIPKQSKSYFDLQPLNDIHFNSKYSGEENGLKLSI